MKGRLATLRALALKGWLPELPPVGNTPMIALPDLVHALALLGAQPTISGNIFTLSDGERYPLDRIARAMHRLAGRARRRMARSRGPVRAGAGHGGAGSSGCRCRVRRWPCRAAWPTGRWIPIRACARWAGLPRSRSKPRSPRPCPAGNGREGRAVMRALAVAAAAFVVAWCVTWFYWRWALRVGRLDVPGARSSHAIATPTGGGAGIVAGWRRRARHDHGRWRGARGLAAGVRPGAGHGGAGVRRRPAGVAGAAAAARAVRRGGGHGALRAEGGRHRTRRHGAAAPAAGTARAGLAEQRLQFHGRDRRSRGLAGGVHGRRGGMAACARRGCRRLGAAARRRRRRGTRASWR